MMEFVIERKGIRSVSDPNVNISWTTISNEFPEFLRNSNDNEVFYKAALQLKKKGKIYQMIYPYVIKRCPFCNLEFKAELQLRLLDRTLNYCPNCGKSNMEIYENWRMNVVIKDETEEEDIEG